MLEPLTISNGLLWVIVIAQGVVLLALARQIGVLHERSAPLGAMVTDAGPEVGDEAPKFELDDFYGNPVVIGGGGQHARDTLLVFLAPFCPMCNKLLPTIKALARVERLDVIIISDGAKEDHEHFLRRHPLGDIPYVVSAEVGIGYRIGRVPYAVLLDQKGVIRAKGLVNTREHLESLIEAKAMDVPSLQAYLKRGAAHETEHLHANGGLGEPSTTLTRS